MVYKRGIYTSEFWVSMLALSVAGLVVIHQVHYGKLDAMGALGVLGAAIALLYKSKRERVKSQSEDKPKPPVGPAAGLILSLVILSGCVVNVPQETADAAARIREDFAIYRANVAPINTSTAEAIKTDDLGILIDKNLKLLSRLTAEGVDK